MRRTLSAVTAAAFTLAMAAATLMAEPKTIQGEVVDVTCHAKKPENVGGGHESCAMSCAKRGAKMGILAADGVYEIAGAYTADNNKKLLEFVAKKVDAKGEVTEKDGK